MCALDTATLDTRVYAFNTRTYAFNTHTYSFNTHAYVFNTHVYVFNTHVYVFNTHTYTLDTATLATLATLAYAFNTRAYTLNNSNTHAQARCLASSGLEVGKHMDGSSCRGRVRRCSVRGCRCGVQGEWESMGH